MIVRFKVKSIVDRQESFLATTIAKPCHVTRHNSLCKTIVEALLKVDESGDNITRDRQHQKVDGYDNVGTSEDLPSTVHLRGGCLFHLSLAPPLPPIEAVDELMMMILQNAFSFTSESMSKILHAQTMFSIFLYIHNSLIIIRYIHLILVYRD